jgi:hypothetical protein
MEKEGLKKGRGIGKQGDRGFGRGEEEKGR